MRPPRRRGPRDHRPHRHRTPARQGGRDPHRPAPQTARDRINTWLDERGRHPGPLWPGQRGPLTISGIVQVVLAVGAGADVAQVQALPGHASIDTAARYFRAGSAENAAVIERIFDH
ncbi:MAG: hypothetical protein ACRDOH_28160 [Streptosporangiaceae bacterium]